MTDGAAFARFMGARFTIRLRRIDTFRGWQREFAAKFGAGISELRCEALEAPLCEATSRRAHDPRIPSGCWALADLQSRKL
jgi:hypothetical protein